MKSNTTDPTYETLSPSGKELILKEIEIINGDIKKFDDYSFVIKGWSITLWTGFIAWLIVNIEEGLLSEFTIYASIIILLAFWFLDGLMKYFQRIFVRRNEVLEDFINDEKLKVEIKIEKKNQPIEFKFFNYDMTSRLTIEKISKEHRNKFKKRFFKKRKFYKCFFVRIVSSLYQLFIIFTLGIALFFSINICLNWILIVVFTVSIILCWWFSSKGWI